MTQVSNNTYYPIVTLALDDGVMPVDSVIDTASLVLSFSRYDWAVMRQIVGEHGRTRRGAAVARAYFEAKDA